MAKSLDEQETTIGWMRDSDKARIYTSDTTMMTRFDKFTENGDWKLIQTEYVGDSIISKTYEAPKKLVFGRGKSSKSSELTPEERQARAARMRAIRQ